MNKSEGELKKDLSTFFELHHIDYFIEFSLQANIVDSNLNLSNRVVVHFDGLKVAIGPQVDEVAQYSLKTHIY